MKRKPMPALSGAQAEIMELVWKHGELAASRVRELLGESRPVARNTVRTLLERMEAKGWLKHREDGRTFLYSAATPRAASIGRRVVEVLDQACGGAPEAMMSALLDYRGLSAAELDRIREMLDAATPANGKPAEPNARTRKGGAR